jgi:gluconokinase
VTRVLAIDVGTSSVRAQTIDEALEPVDELARERYDGHDPDETVRIVRDTVGDRARDADAIGISCFGHSLLVLDDNDRPLTPILGWRDTRSADAAELLARKLDVVAVHARTGCTLHSSYWPAKLAWLRDAEPGVSRNAARFVSFGEYLALRLWDAEPRMSLSSASATGLLDVTALVWDAELLDVLGVRPEQLPEVSDESTDGRFPAWLDGACSNVGSGCVQRERAAVMVGTSAALRVIYETEQPLPRPGLFLYRVDDHRVLEGGALSDGGNLHAWLEQTLTGSEGSLADRDPDSHGLTFLPFLGGERSTGWDPNRTGVLAGLTFETTPLDIRQAGLEGIAFRLAEIADLLPDLEDVVASGGALQADPHWLQIVADALGRPVTASGVEEASLRGAAVLALERLGFDAPSAPLGRVLHPRADRAETYRSARERQRQLYDVMREWK